LDTLGDGNSSWFARLPAGETAFKVCTGVDQFVINNEASSAMGSDEAFYVAGFKGSVVISRD